MSVEEAKNRELKIVFDALKPVQGLTATMCVEIVRSFDRLILEVQAEIPCDGCMDASCLSCVARTKLAKEPAHAEA